MKTRVLIIYDYYLPAYKAGGPVQSLVNLVELMGDELDIFVLTGSTDIHEKSPLPGIVMDEWVQVGKAKVFYASGKSLAVVDEAVAFTDPDVIYLSGMFSLYYMVYPVLKYTGKRKLILAPRGMLAPGALKIKKWKKKPYLQMLRSLNLASRVVFHATKDNEASEIRKVFGSGARIVSAGNIPFVPVKKKPEAAYIEETLHLYTVSRISPEKNILYVVEMLRCGGFTRPVCLHLIGNPENRLYTDRCMNLVQQLPAEVSVEWLGHLESPAIAERISGYHVFVLPTLGENFGHAIYEALGAGKPVIISDQTPWHELEETRAGFELALDTPDEWLEKVRLFSRMDGKTYAEWSTGAWEYARRYYEGLDLKKEYMKMFTEIKD
jgi:glycosyltransferase involved in cell wall biosynthesis